MRPLPRWLCGAVFLVPLWCGVTALPATWAGVRQSAAALTAVDLAALPDGPEKDYRFLRDVARQLRREDRLLLFQDGRLRDIAIPILAGGWYGATDIVFDPDEAATRAELQAQGRSKAEIEQAIAFLASLRRPAAELAQLLSRANVAVALRSPWSPEQGTLLLAAGSSHRAWRLR